MYVIATVMTVAVATDNYHNYSYRGASKIFRTDAVKIINLTTKPVLKLPTSTQRCATWHTDSLNMVVLPSTGASRYHNCCIDGSTSPEYFGFTLVLLYVRAWGGVVVKALRY
jgi:hypothetical protein